MDEADFLNLAQKIIASSNTRILVDADTINFCITDPSSIYCGATILWLIMFHPAFNRPDFLIALAQQSPYTLSGCLLDQAPAGQPSVLWYMAHQQPDTLVHLAQRSSGFLDYVNTLDLNATYNGISIIVALLISQPGRTFIMQCPMLLFKASFNPNETLAIKQNWQSFHFPELETFLKLLILVEIDLPTNLINDFDRTYLSLKQSLNTQVNTWMQPLWIQNSGNALAHLLPQAQWLQQQIKTLHPDLHFLNNEFTSKLIQKRLASMQSLDESLGAAIGSFSGLNVEPPGDINALLAGLGLH